MTTKFTFPSAQPPPPIAQNKIILKLENQFRVIFLLVRDIKSNKSSIKLSYLNLIVTLEMTFEFETLTSLPVSKGTYHISHLVLPKVCVFGYVHLEVLEANIGFILICHLLDEHHQRHTLRLYYLKRQLKTLISIKAIFIV